MQSVNRGIGSQSDGSAALAGAIRAGGPRHETCGATTTAGDGEAEDTGLVGAGPGQRVPGAKGGAGPNA